MFVAQSVAYSPDLISISSNERGIDHFSHNDESVYPNLSLQDSSKRSKMWIFRLILRLLIKYLPENKQIVVFLCCLPFPNPASIFLRWQFRSIERFFTPCYSVQKCLRVCFPFFWHPRFVVERVKSKSDFVVCASFCPHSSLANISDGRTTYKCSQSDMNQRNKK